MYYDANARSKALQVFQEIDTENLIEALKILPKAMLPSHQVGELERYLAHQAEKDAQRLPLFNEPEKVSVPELPRTAPTPRKYTAGYGPRGKAPGNTARGDLDKHTDEHSELRPGKGPGAHVLPKLTLGDPKKRSVDEWVKEVGSVSADENSGSYEVGGGNAY